MGIMGLGDLLGGATLAVMVVDGGEGQGFRVGLFPDGGPLCSFVTWPC